MRVVDVADDGGLGEDVVACCQHGVGWEQPGNEHVAVLFERSAQRIEARAERARREFTEVLGSRVEGAAAGGQFALRRRWNPLLGHPTIMP